MQQKGLLVLIILSCATGTESHALVVAVSACALVLFAEEHLLSFVPYRNVNSLVTECRQDAVEQIFVDRFC